MIPLMMLGCPVSCNILKPRIRSVNNPCFTSTMLSVFFGCRYSINYMGYSTLYYKIELVSADFVQL
jgi:hypothetical protein